MRSRLRGITVIGPDVHRTKEKALGGEFIATVEAFPIKLDGDLHREGHARPRIGAQAFAHLQRELLFSI